ncbi:HlyD family efflux transporter periplasmic adaptor subunit [Salmonella enterica]|nr:HlyD family efflux transporter periplasmic adaptor subunit [Salmonella enterica]EBD7602080.1 HlyD family efflux transporter periplasmic adaptor subunit [Salmonella enterica]
MFRKEVFEEIENGHLGDVHISSPVSYVFLGVICLFITGLILLFLFFGHYTHRETVTGVIIPSNGVVNITSGKSSGVITELYVHQGDNVKRGSKLFKVINDRSIDGAGSVQEVINENIRKQIKEMSKEIDNNKILLNNGLELLNTTLILLYKKKNETLMQIKTVSDKVKEDERFISSISDVYKKKYISELDMRQQKIQYSNDIQNLKNLNIQLIDTMKQIKDGEHQLTSLPLEYSIKNGQILSRINEMRSTISQNSSDRENIITSKSDGVVSSILFYRGQNVSIGETIISLLPSNSFFIAELFVPSNAMGFIKTGNKVVLRYQAYPYQKFGQQYGEIYQISRNILTPRELTSVTGSQIQSPFYRVLVKLEHQYVPVYDKKETLMSGMLINADILTDKRTLIEWVLEPLYGLKEKYID